MRQATRQQIAAAAEQGAVTLAKDAERLRRAAHEVRDCLEDGPLSDPLVEYHLRSLLQSHSELYGARRACAGAGAPAAKTTPLAAERPPHHRLLRADRGRLGAHRQQSDL